MLKHVIETHLGAVLSRSAGENYGLSSSEDVHISIPYQLSTPQEQFRMGNVFEATCATMQMYCNDQIEIPHKIFMQWLDGLRGESQQERALYFRFYGQAIDSKKDTTYKLFEQRMGVILKSLPNIQIPPYELFTKLMAPDVDPNSFVCHAMLLCGTCDLPAKLLYII